MRKALQQMAEDREIVVSTGAARFTRSDKKTVGYVYLRNGRVYAAHINTYVPNIMTRLVQAGYLDQNAVNTVSRKFGDNLSDPNISDFILDNHLVPEKIMDSISQDFFLEIFQYLISWDNVNADWRDKETTDYLKIDNFELNKIITIVDARQEFIKGVAEQFGVDLINLGVITFKTKGAPVLDDETPMMFHQIYSIANGEWDIQSAANNFGLTHFRVVQAIYELWKADYLALSYETYPINDYVDPEPKQQAEEPNQAGSSDEQPIEGSNMLVDDDSKEIPVYVEEPQVAVEPEVMAEPVQTNTGSVFVAPIFESDDDEVEEEFYTSPSTIIAPVIPVQDDFADSPLLAKLYGKVEPEQVESLPLLAAEEPNANLYGSGLTQEELTEPAYLTPESPKNVATPTLAETLIAAPTVSENGSNALEALLNQLSQELETRRLKIAKMRDDIVLKEKQYAEVGAEIALKEKQYANIGAEIAEKTSELDKIQDEYEQIVNKVNIIK